MKTFNMNWAFWIVLASTSPAAQAANFYVQETLAEPGIDATDAHVATKLIEGAVSSRPGDHLIGNKSDADFILQPRLLKLGDEHLLTVEKISNNEVVYVAQTKLAHIEDLDPAARRATLAVITEPAAAPTTGQEPQRPQRETASEAMPEPMPGVPYIIEVVPPPGRAASASPSSPSSSSASSSTSSTSTSLRQPASLEPDAAQDTARSGQSQTRIVHVLPPRKIGYVSLGVGSFISRRLDTDRLMYGFNLGYRWDIDPRVALKLTGEANFSSGADSSRFLNLNAGANYFLPVGLETVPFLTADFGYGFADANNGEQADGFGIGIGAGLEFLRTTETTVDLLLRYAVILDSLETTGGSPALIGARTTVNF